MLVPENIYWHYQRALPEDFCNKVIKFALNKIRRDDQGVNDEPVERDENRYLALLLNYFL